MRSVSQLFQLFQNLISSQPLWVWILLVGALLLTTTVGTLYTFYSCNPFLANKDDYYQWMKGPYFAEQILYRPGQTHLQTLDYPIVMKPNVCSGEGRQVSKIHNSKEAEEYIRNFDKSLGDNIVIQRFNPAKYEVGVLYQRYPWQKHGQIISLGNRTPPDENSTTKTKTVETTSTNKFVPRSCHNVDCSDKSEWLTPINRAILIREIERMPSINVCRLDILFDNLDDFKAGRNFQIIEVNGRMGFDLANYSVNSKVVRQLYNLVWFGRRFLIGSTNILKFNGINIPLFLKHIFWKLVMAWREDNLEFLVTQDYYEPSYL